MGWPAARVKGAALPPQPFGQLPHRGSGLKAQSPKPKAKAKAKSQKPKAKAKAKSHSPRRIERRGE